MYHDDKHNGPVQNENFLLRFSTCQPLPSKPDSSKVQPFRSFRAIAALLFLLAAISGCSGSPPTFSITGSTGVSGVVVTASGPTVRKVTSGTGGGYSLSGLIDGSFVVTASAKGYAFTPASQNVVVNNANAVANFTATQLTYTLSGRTGVAGATVKASGPVNVSTTSGPEGSFILSGLVIGTYTITASETGYSFSPSVQYVVIDAANASTSFTAIGSGVVASDVVVYAATPSGIAAAIESGKLGKQVVLIEPSQHVGGIATSGLGHTDLYNMNALGGFVKQFFSTVHSIYGSHAGDSGGTLYEPHVAELAFQQLLAQQPNITIVYGVSAASATMNGTTLSSLTGSDGVQYRAVEFVDASYTGDLMAAANVSYSVGRESSAQYNESMAGVVAPELMDGRGIDPYLIPGNSASGLLPHVFPNTLGAPGSADQGVMAYNYRLCVTTAPDNQIALTPPANYDPEEFEFLGRLLTELNNEGKPPELKDFISLYALPDNKFDLNVAALPSTDEVGESAPYPDGSPAVRGQIEDEIQRYMRAYFQFLRTDPRVPASVASQVQALGLCRDEFTDNNGWPRQVYVREARRMIGPYVLTQNDVLSSAVFPDAIGVGGFIIDCHLVNRPNVNGTINNEGVVQTSKSSLYTIPYRILTPQASQATNLLVSVAVSASHVAFDSLRVEPTYMIMGQAAGSAASLAIDEDVPVQQVNYQALQSQLLNDGQVLTIP